MNKIAVGISRSKQKKNGKPACHRKIAVTAVLAAGLLPILLSGCGGGGGGSAPVVPPKTASLLSITSAVVSQSATAETLLVLRAALLSSATFPVSVAFSTSGATVGSSCTTGIDYRFPATSGVSISFAGNNARGVLTLASAASSRDISVFACPDTITTSTDKMLALAWNDGAASGSATATVRGSANASLARSMPLNDTGITSCATGSVNNLACPQSGFAGQDGETGRDANTAITGQGIYRTSAFALNKLSDAKNCIQDGVTGLTWEGKTTSSGLHDASATYTWFDSNASTNGGSSGTPSGGVCTGSGCDTEQFVTAVNAELLCGYTDWRLPTAQELGGIVDAGAIAALTINATFANQAAKPYWTASPKATLPLSAWGVDFENGAIGFLSKSTPYRVRLVRGNSYQPI